MGSLGLLADHCSGSVLWVVEWCRAEDALALSRSSQAWYSELLHPGIWHRYLAGAPEFLARTVLADNGARQALAGEGVHPENYKFIVAALRDPGWFRHYQGMKRLSISGCLRERLRAPPGQLGGLQGSLRAQAIGRELQARWHAEPSRIQTPPRRKRTSPARALTPPRRSRPVAAPSTPPRVSSSVKRRRFAATMSGTGAAVQEVAKLQPKPSAKRGAQSRNICRDRSSSASSSSSTSSSSYYSSTSSAALGARAATKSRGRTLERNKADIMEAAGSSSSAQPSIRVTTVPHGRCTWPDGRHYEGSLRNGQPDGFGKMTSPNGLVYEGQFTSGRPHGNGTLRGGQGTSVQIYKGEFWEGKRHGAGKLYLPDGRTYTGTFVNGQAQGDGVLHSSEGAVLYQGRFQATPKEGNGALLVVKPAGQKSFTPEAVSQDQAAQSNTPKQRTLQRNASVCL
eukprot:TRINITY_DN106221_c0_g1_i1.p1 TRINITY_DN106221_c0_g1~~TRINITY_DN106221_c0_g1_i1.p1  ORF type:complete len:454 (-),score=59.91 TRINITY_DN106221_c0_g1_i1:85-1446(-)